MKVLQKITAAFVVIALGIMAFAPQSHAQVDYKKALVYTSPDERFKIKQNFRIQFRADFVDETGSDLETDFMIRRMKLKYGGHAYEKWLKYGFQLAGSVGRDDRPREDDIKIEDAFIVFAKSTAADLKVGRYKIPFEREVLNSSSSLQFVDRSGVKEFGIGADRTDGISVGGIFGNMIAYRMGVFQEDGVKFSGGDNVLLAGRVQANICCGGLKYSGGSFTAGGDYKVSPNFAKVPTFALGLGGFVNTGDSGGDRSGVTADFAAKIERANFEAAFYYDDEKTGSTSNGNIAYRIQAGAMLTSGLEAAVRWAAADYDSAPDEREITFGLNYYLAKHRAKVQVDYSNINEKDGISQGRDRKENRVRAQIQVHL